MRKALLAITVLFSLSANAEIWREARTCANSNQMCFYWWPKLKDIKGWEQDILHSYHYKMNTQVPTGLTFANAETVIYARAVYKPRMPGTKDLEQFIADDKADFLNHDPALSISQLELLKDKKGRSFIIYKFTPTEKGNWEQIAYSEEVDSDGNEYYLVFVLNSRSEYGYKKALDDFHKFISSYE